MRKTILLVMLAALLTAGLVFTSCDDDGGGDLVLTGTTWIYEADFFGEIVEMARIEFLTANSYTAIYMKGIPINGTYTISGNTVTMTPIAGDQMVGTVSGNSMTVIDEDDDVMVFVKQ